MPGNWLETPYKWVQLLIKYFKLKSALSSILLVKFAAILQMINILTADCVSQVAVLKSDGSAEVKALEKGAWSAVSAATGQAQKVVTFHVAENGETVLQEAYEAANSEAGELTQIAIEAYEGEGDFSVVEQPTEEIHSSGYR